MSLSFLRITTYEVMEDLKGELAAILCRTLPAAPSHFPRFL